MVKYLNMKPKKYQKPEQFIKYLIEEFGYSIFKDTQRCLSIAYDMFEGDKQVSFLIKTAFKNKVYETLLKAKNSSSENKLIYIEKAVNILIDDCGIDKDKAINIVGWLSNTVFSNEWESFLNNFYSKIKQKTDTDNNYIKLLQKENEKLKNLISQKDIEIISLKKQLEAKTIVVQPNQTQIIPTKDSNSPLNDIQTINIAGKISILEDINLEMVSCPSGSFMMGSPESGIFAGELGRYKDELIHKVNISKPFKIGKFPITQSQYKAIMGNNPSHFIGNNNPVENVNWYHAKEFCKQLNSLYKNKLPNGYIYDLPTEAQWEFACRAGTPTALNSGENLTSSESYCSNLDKVGWYIENSNNTTHSVGQKKPNAWGIYDMHGNVWEWCEDMYVDYPSYPVTDPVGQANISYRIRRGGSWTSNAKYCRSAFRNYNNPNICDNNVGFRVALVPIG